MILRKIIFTLIYFWKDAFNHAMTKDMCVWEHGSWCSSESHWNKWWLDVSFEVDWNVCTLMHPYISRLLALESILLHVMRAGWRELGEDFKKMWHLFWEYPAQCVLKCCFILVCIAFAYLGCGEASICTAPVPQLYLSCAYSFSFQWLGSWSTV